MPFWWTPAQNHSKTGCSRTAARKSRYRPAFSPRPAPLSGAAQSGCGRPTPNPWQAPWNQPARRQWSKTGFWSSFPAYNTYGEIISGYRQILQKIKTATSVIDNGDGTYSFENPGRVIVFIPSGLAYFSESKGFIAAYSPLIFDISLISLREADHDNDSILDKFEDVNGNGNLWDDDTDGDGKPDFLDIDDDGDGYTTKEEITYTTTENGQTIIKLYSFNEIPTCNGGLIKKHLDKNCH